MKPPVFVLLPLLFALGCSSSASGPSSATGTTETPLVAADYSQECSTDAECVAVYEGDPCTGLCLCANSSIAASSEPAYEADLKSALQACNAKSSTCNCPAESSSCDPTTKKCRFSNE